MRPSKCVSAALAAALFAAPLAAAPRTAHAAGAVQPVPYSQSQPVPYALTSPAPSAATASAAPRLAARADAGSDVVVLKSGGMIRGTLLEVLPNDHATVQLATGQDAIIQWDQIHHIERGGALPPPPAATKPLLAGGTAVVHIESDRPVTLETQEGPRKWVFACASPCDAELPSGVDYRIVGDGVRASSPFRLAAHAGEHVTLDVSAASKGGFAGGIVLVSVGPVVMLVGLVVVIFEATAQTFETANSNTFGSTGTSTLPGWITVGVGGVATLGGILLMTGNSHSTVEQSLRAAPADSAQRAGEAWLRRPTWRDDKGPSLGAAGAVPLFGGRF